MIEQSHEETQMGQAKYLRSSRFSGLAYAEVARERRTFRVESLGLVEVCVRQYLEQGST